MTNNNDDEAVRVAVSIRLGMGLCAAHTCRCRSLVTIWGLHALVCKMAQVVSQGIMSFNDIISLAFASAKIPVSKEPSGLFRSDGKRPDGLTLTPWQRSLSLTWTLQSLPCWHLHPQLAPQLRLWRPGNKASMPRCQGRTCFSRFLWKLWAQSTNRLCSSKTVWATESLLSLPMTRKDNLSSNNIILYRSVEIQRYLAARVVWE